MIVVIAGSYGAYCHHSVLATFVLLKAEFLIERVVGHHNEVGCMIESVRRKARLHSGRESERLGIVYFRKKHLCCIGSQLGIIGVDKQVGFLRSYEGDDAVLFAHMLVGTV